jgi:hypothetical protein
MADEIHYEMTGSLRNTEYNTKSDLIKHLEGFGYVKDDMSGEGYGTSPDDACELLLTDSYDSKSSKMYKAQKLGIRILTYEDLLKEL